MAGVSKGVIVNLTPLLGPPGTAWAGTTSNSVIRYTIYSIPIQQIIYRTKSATCFG